MPITLERTPIQNQLYAKCLMDSGASIRAISRKTGLTQDTLRVIRDEVTLQPSMLEKFKARMPLRFARLVDDTLDCMDRADIKKAPIQTRMWIAGVATDKLQALEGSNRPVFNIVTVVQGLDKRINALDAQEKALLALKEGG